MTAEEIARALPDAPPRLKLVMVGRSEGPICGVRDHAGVLSQALEEAGVAVTTVWSHAGAEPTATLGALAREVRRRCRELRPDAVLVHYSVFAYARRGIPFGVPAFAWRLRACDTPAVLLAHEFAYPWRRRGWRGTAHALTQRVALVPLVAASAACIATTDKNARYLRSRRWLPRRRVGVAPVFSNISPGAATAGEVAGRVGVFGFGTGGPAVPLTVGAVARAAETVGQAHLVLIGSPGPDGPVADEWRAAARDTGCRLHFTGVGTVGEISAHLRAVQVVILADDGGPSSRKGSLAAALAHGKPVVAFDGPETWPDLAASGAVELVPLDVEQAAARVTSLLTDRERRTSLGRAALEFSRSELAPERIAAAIGRLVIEVADVGGAPRPPVMEGRHG